MFCGSVVDASRYKIQQAVLGQCLLAKLETLTDYTSSLDPNRKLISLKMYAEG